MTAADERPTTRSPLTALAVTSIVNFIIGTQLGGWVSAYFAEQHSDRELQRTWLQERSKHQMAVRKEFLEEQRTTIDAVHQLISRLREASIDLVYITSSDYDEESFKGDKSKKVEDEKSETVDTFRDAVDAWERQRYFYDFALASFHGEGDVHAAWAEARDAATKMGQCASDWYYAVLRKEAVYGKDTPRPCEAQENDLDKKWEVLSARLRAARENAWNDWQNPPQRLK